MTETQKGSIAMADPNIHPEDITERVVPPDVDDDDGDGGDGDDGDDGSCWDSFLLSPAEDAQLERLARPFLEQLQREYGDRRSLQALTGLVGHVLERILAAPNACCVVEVLNFMLNIAHCDGEIDPWELAQYHCEGCGAGGDEDAAEAVAVVPPSTRVN
jgi:hypothetical protein